MGPATLSDPTEMFALYRIFPMPEGVLLQGFQGQCAYQSLVLPHERGTDGKANLIARNPASLPKPHSTEPYGNGTACRSWPTWPKQWL